ncbi:MAG: AMP-binding protein, partial [Gallionella sp.]
MQQKDVISPEQAGTLYGLFLERVRRSPDKKAYRYFQQNAWRDITWREMQGEVARWQKALAELGLQRGDRVAIMLRNCPQWVMFDQAAMSLGLVVVPLYTVDRPENIAYIVNDAEVKVLLFENIEQWQALCTVRDQLGGIVRFVSVDPLRDGEEPRLKSMMEFLPATAQLQAGNPLPQRSPHLGPSLRSPLPLAGEEANVKSNLQPLGELASIIYTSGTTGRPKGVMLSHLNMLSNAYDVLDTFTVYGDDLFLSFLPLSHTFERTCGYYLAIMTGATVAYARSIPQLSEDL